jgi:hypothetical protein
MRHILKKLLICVTADVQHPAPDPEEMHPILPPE